MRDLTVKLLTIILCIVLLVNFTRVFFLPSESNLDDYTPVDVFSIFDAISEIDVDPVPLYDSVGDVLGTLLAVSYSASAFTLAWSKGSTPIESILSVLISGYTFIANIGLVIYLVAVSIIEGVEFLFDLWNAILKFLNAILGSVFSYAKINIPSFWQGSTGDAYHGGGDGFAGGGYGGRR